MAQSPFSSLHKDIAWQILARVPKRLYPILACVSKNLRSLVHSPDIHETRALLRKDSLYICFINEAKVLQVPNWFILRRSDNNPSENQFVSVVLEFPEPNEPMPSIIAYGPEIFFISGSFIPSKALWIYDSRTGVFRQGLSMKVAHSFKCVGSVGSKIYVVGGSKIHQAESFHVKTETWEPAPSPELDLPFLSTANVSLDRKVCALKAGGAITVCYDIRDGSCEVFDLPTYKWWRTSVCVMDNVLYVYYARFGLMWYDTELKLWRVVNGLDGLKKVRSIGMAEYYGKLALLWEEYGVVVGGVTKEIWCRMIALDRSGEGISGSAESGQLMGSIPSDYMMQHCLSVSE